MKRGLAWLLVVLLTTGCATRGAGVSIYGRQVTAVEIGEAEKRRSPEGELIAAEPARLWLLGKEQVFEVPLSSVEEVRVRRHNFTPGKALLWSVLGAIVTGGALAAACSSVEGTRGLRERVRGRWAGIWLGIGGLAAASMSGSSSTRLPRPKAEDLSPYARFPQGVPEGFDPRTLRPSPAPTR